MKRVWVSIAVILPLAFLVLASKVAARASQDQQARESLSHVSGKISPSITTGKALFAPQDINTADLGVTKTDSPDPVSAGNTLTYTINITNSGTTTATNVVMTDTLPTAVTFVSNVPGQGTCTGTGPVRCDLGDILASGNTNVMIVTTANTAGTITNTVTITTTAIDTNLGNNTAIQATTVQPSADLQLVKIDLTDPVTAGNDFTYQITVTNNGPSSATTPTLVDTLPTGVTFVSASIGCTENTGLVTCNLSTMAPSAVTVVTITVHVPASTASGTVLSNSATVSSTTPDPAPANDTEGETTAVNTSADLSVVKTDSPDPVTAGNNLVYQVTVTNNGPSNATTPALVDTLPAVVTFVSAPGCTQVGVTVTCNLSTMAPSATTQVTITVHVPASTTSGTVLTNSATVSSTTPDPTPANDTDGETTTVNTSADLSVVKTDSPDPVTAGNNLVYQVTVTNNGPSNATTPALVDTLPAGVTFVSAPGCTQAGVTVTCNLSTLIPSGTAQVTITVHVPASTTSGTVLSNSATVSSTTPDPTPANDTEGETTTVNTSADLSVVKTDSPDPVIAGNNLVYQVTVTNNGPSNATTPTLVDTLPAGVTFVSAPGCTQVGVTVTCNLATLAPAGVTVVTITVQVNPSTTGSLSNTATVSSTTSDPNLANNTEGETTTVNTSADVSITKTDFPDALRAGDPLTYTLTIVNNGPSNALGVTVSDPLPDAQVNFQSVSTNQGTCTGGATVSCTLGTILPAGTVTVIIHVQVDPGAGLGTITNTATLSSPTPDPVTSNNSATETTTIANIFVNLQVTKSDSPDPVVAGQSLTYTIHVTNAGPSNATGVTLTDALPAGVTFVSVSPGLPTCSHTSGTVSCNLGAVAVGSDITVVITTNVNPSASGTLSNTVTVSGVEADTNLDNNTATQVTTVNTRADIRVTKSDSPDPVVAGNNLTYTINVTNDGPSNAATPTLVDTLPAGVTFVSVSPGLPTCSQVGVTVTCNLATMIPSGTAQVTITVRVNPSTTGSLSNTVSVSSPTTDPNSANNTSTALTGVDTQADLSIGIQDNPDPVTAGNPLTYTLTITNSGPSDAANVVLQADIPTGTTFISVNPNAPICVKLGNLLECDFPTRAAGTSTQVVMSVIVNPPTVGTIQISASVSSDNDPNTGNNSATENTTSLQPDVSIPEVNWVLPVANGEVLHVGVQNVTLSATATDDIGVVRVRFYRWDTKTHQYVDINNIFTPPYQVSFYTGTLNCGWNQIFVAAYDAAGHVSQRKWIWLYLDVCTFLPS